MSTTSKDRSPQPERSGATGRRERRRGGAAGAKPPDLLERAAAAVAIASVQIRALASAARACASPERSNTSE
jgi:hypothetical protein